MPNRVVALLLAGFLALGLVYIAVDGQQIHSEQSISTSSSAVQPLDAFPPPPGNPPCSGRVCPAGPSGCIPEVCQE